MTDIGGLGPAEHGELLSTTVKATLAGPDHARLLQAGRAHRRASGVQGTGHQSVAGTRSPARLGGHRRCDDALSAGVRVRMPTSEELADISVVRSEIDALAATIAVPLMNDEIVAQLRDAYDEMRRQQADGN